MDRQEVDCMKVYRIITEEATRKIIEEVAPLWLWEGYTVEEIAEYSVYSKDTIQKVVEYVKSQENEFIQKMWLG